MFVGMHPTIDSTIEMLRDVVLPALQGTPQYYTVQGEIEKLTRLDEDIVVNRVGKLVQSGLPNDAQSGGLKHKSLRLRWNQYDGDGKRTHGSGKIDREEVVKLASEYAKTIPGCNDRELHIHVELGCPPWNCQVLRGGWPDFFVNPGYKSATRQFAVEVKSPHDVLTVQQEAMRILLERSGIPVLVVRTRGELRKAMIQRGLV